MKIVIFMLISAVSLAAVASQAVEPEREGSMPMMQGQQGGIPMMQMM